MCIRDRFTIVKGAVQHLADKCGRKFGPDTLDFGQILDLLCVRMCGFRFIPAGFSDVKPATVPI